MAIVINIDFNDEIAEGNLVACFHEPFASGGRPKRIELTRAQVYLSFLTHVAGPALKRQ